MLQVFLMYGQNGQNVRNLVIRDLKKGKGIVLIE